MKHIKPQDVVSPKANWRLIDVVLDRGEGDCAYALGMWDNRRCVGFRWNGTKIAHSETRRAEGFRRGRFWIAHCILPS